MSFSNLTVGQRYTCNGVTVNFAIPFAFISGLLSTIKVYTIDTTEGTRTLKTLTTDYTLSPSGNNPTTVVFNTAPASTVKVSIERLVPFTQIAEFISSRYTAQTHENSFDKVMMLLQQINSGLLRTPQVHVFDLDNGFSPDMEPAVASGYLRMKSDKSGFEYVDALLEPGSTFDDVSPMTTEGDIIIQGSSGAIRLAKGAAYQELAMDSLGNRPAWRTPPMTTRGDILYHNGTIPARLAKGGVGALLKMGADDPGWLARGTALQVLRTNAGGTDIEWATPDNYAVGQFGNISIHRTINAGAVTFTLKSGDGTDFSSTNKGFVYFKNVAAASTTFTRVEITANLTFTLTSGSTLGLVSGTASWVYLYLINNSGTPEIAISTTRYDDASDMSTTAEGGAGAADSATVFYSTTARVSLPYVLLGRMNMVHSAGAWQTVSLIASPLGTKRLGAWVSRSENTAYQALSDGLFMGLGTTADSSGNECTKIYADSDANSSPSTTRAGAYFYGHSNAHQANGQVISFCIPVKAGEYYLGNINNFVGAMTTNRSYFWMPLE